MYMKIVTKVLAAFCIISYVACQAPFDKCETNKYPPDRSLLAPTYVVNLDLPPQQRWKAIATQFAKPVAALITYIKSFILEFSPKLQSLINLVDNDLGKLADTLPAPYGDEIKGIANATGIPLGDVVFYNIFYEVFTLCTSIVAQDTQGNVYHARNLDFGLFLGWDLSNDTWIISELLRPIIINVNFTRKGAPLYTSVTFVGFVGAITAVKPNAFSYSMNERFGADGGYIGLFEWLLDINRKQAWTTLIARDVFEVEDLDFDKAVKTLSSAPLLAPCYYIMGGPGDKQGAIITRNRENSADVWRMGTNGSVWYLVETNYDHWKPPFFLDDRLTPANICLNQTGQANINFKTMFNVLSTRPVLNKLTVYTALMEVKTGRVETYIQDCKSPCWPF